MAPHLHPSVVAAIETAVEVNNGVLEPASIHSLAKIYKTSPQAIVWNMKRYNKVKANSDDRQKTSRRPVMDKDAAAEETKLMLENNPSTRMEKIAQMLFEKFGVHVSTTWVSRLMSSYGIVYKMPKPPKVKKARVSKLPRSVEVPEALEQTQTHTQREDGSFQFVAPRYQLPPVDLTHPPLHPTFRQDLQHAIVSAPPPPPPPMQHWAPPPPSVLSEEQTRQPLFGMLKLSKVPQPPQQRSVLRHRPAPQSPLMHNARLGSGGLYMPNPADMDPDSDSNSSIEFKNEDNYDRPPATQPQSLPPPTNTSSAGVTWKVLEVVECA